MNAALPGLEPEADIRAQVLQDVDDIIRSVSISRGAVMTSTPEQIVWMTVKAIEENLIAYARGEDPHYRWFPQCFGMAADIRRAVDQSKLAASAKATALRVIDKAIEGWPA